MLRSLLLLPALVALALGQAPAQSQRPVFRSEAHFVTVDAYPLRNGQVVEGLTAADFVVEEDGQPQTIDTIEFISATSAEPESARRDPNTIQESRLLAADARTRAFVVYLDIPHVSVAGARAARVPLVTMLNRLIGDRDLFAVTTSELPPQALTFVRKTTTAEDMLARHWAWGTRDSIQRTPLEDEFDRCFPADAMGQEGWIRDGTAMRTVANVLRDRAREDEALQRLEDLVAYLGHLREGRTSVILFTEGWRLFRDGGGLMTYTGRTMPGCTQHLIRYANIDGPGRLREIMARANRGNVTFFPVNPGGLTAFDAPISERVMGTGNITESPIAQGFDNLRDRASALQTLAQNTDGFAVVNTNNVKEGLQRVTDALSAYYLLGYYSTNTKFDGRMRQIKVRVTQPGVQVTARRGYTAPTEAERAARAAAAAAPAGPSGPSPIELALDALARLRPSAELFVHATLADGRLTTFVEVSGSQMERGVLARGGTLEIVVTGPSGEAVDTVQVALAPAARAAGVTVAVPSDLTSVIAVAKVRTADTMLEARTEVARDAGAVLGDPLVYRATPASRSPLVPVAGYQFRRTERVHVEWPLLHPLDRREARLLGRSGQPVAVTVALTERENDGRQMLALDVLLAPLAPGDYVLEVVVTAGATTETKLVGIRVVS